MKRFTLLFLISILFTVACKKGETTPANGFVGKWKLVAQKISIGGPAVWYNETQHPEYYVQFYNNGNFTSNSYITYKYAKYSIKDSVYLVLSKNDTIQNFRYQFIKQDTLLMSPNGPIYCIEGCTFKFARQK